MIEEAFSDFEIKVFIIYTIINTIVFFVNEYLLKELNKETALEWNIKRYKLYENESNFFKKFLIFGKTYVYSILYLSVLGIILFINIAKFFSNNVRT